MTPRYAIGDPVRVRAAYPPGHVRTPFYCRGKSGTVVRVCGEFPNPEERAYGNEEARPIPMYRVQFRQTEMWPDYPGDAKDRIEIEVYEHWLKPA